MNTIGLTDLMDAITDAHTRKICEAHPQVNAKLLKLMIEQQVSLDAVSYALGAFEGTASTRVLTEDTLTTLPGRVLTALGMSVEDCAIYIGAAKEIAAVVTNALKLLVATEAAEAKAAEAKAAEAKAAEAKTEECQCVLCKFERSFNKSTGA